MLATLHRLDSGGSWSHTLWQVLGLVRIALSRAQMPKKKTTIAIVAKHSEVEAALPNLNPALPEAVAFISGLLGSPEGGTPSSPSWHGCSRGMEGWQYASVWIEPNGRDIRICVAMCIAESDPVTRQKLYAIFGWAVYHGFAVTWDVGSLEALAGQAL